MDSKTTRTLARKPKPQSSTQLATSLGTTRGSGSSGTCRSPLSGRTPGLPGLPDGQIQRPAYRISRDRKRPSPRYPKTTQAGRGLVEDDQRPSDAQPANRKGQ